MCPHVMFIRALYTDVDEVAGLNIGVLLDNDQPVNFRCIGHAARNHAFVADRVDQHLLCAADLAFQAAAADRSLLFHEALQRAVSRGVTCRVIVDGLGSRALVSSRSWKQMRQAGVKVAVALALGSPLLRLLRIFRGRLNFRNHRKIVVIDDRITYCGSQNCADPEFRIKKKFAPWVDAVMRFDGPVARQNQTLFAVDWLQYTGEDLTWDQCLNSQEALSTTERL